MVEKNKKIGSSVGATYWFRYSNTIMWTEENLTELLKGNGRMYWFFEKRRVVILKIEEELNFLCRNRILIFFRRVYINPNIVVAYINEA